MDKTLTLDSVREWQKSASNVKLSEYTSIADDAAEALVTNEVDVYLELDGLVSLSNASAKSFSRCQGQVRLNGLTSISDAIADILSTQKNGCLSLDGLTSISDAAAEAFSKYEGGYLAFDGVTSLSDAAGIALSRSVGSLWLCGLTTVSDIVAEALSKHQGGLFLNGNLTSLTHAGLAGKLAERDDELDLSGLTELSDLAATALSKTEARLFLKIPPQKLNFDLGMKLLVQNEDDTFLWKLTDLSAANAATLAKYKGELLYFQSLRTLTDEAAVEIANFKGDLNLCGLTALSDIAAEALSRHVGVLDLCGLKSLSDTAAEALSKHNGTLIPPHTLSPKIAAHSLRRYTKGIHLARQTHSSGDIIMPIALQHGKLYDCKLDGDLGTAVESVVQLAIDATTNRRFFLLEGRQIYLANPKFVHKLIDLSFNDLDTTNIAEEYDSRWASAIYEFILDEDGMHQGNSNDIFLYDFIETDVIKYGTTS